LEYSANLPRVGGSCPSGDVTMEAEPESFSNREVIRDISSDTSDRRSCRPQPDFCRLARCPSGRKTPETPKNTAFRDDI